VFAGKDTDSWSLGEIQALVIKAARGSGKHWGWSEEAAYAVDWLEQRCLPGTLAIAALLTAENSQDSSQNKPNPASSGHPTDKTRALCPLETGMQFSDGSLQLAPAVPLQLDAAQPLLLLPFLSLLLQDSSGNSKPHSTSSPHGRYGLSLQFGSSVITMDTDTIETVIVTSTRETVPDTDTVGTVPVSMSAEVGVNNSLDSETPELDYRFHDALIFDQSHCCVQLLELADHEIPAENLTPSQRRFSLKPGSRVTPQAKSAIAILDQLARLTYAPVTEESRHKGAGAGLTDND